MSAIHEAPKSSRPPPMIEDPALSIIDRIVNVVTTLWSNIQTWFAVAAAALRKCCCCAKADKIDQWDEILGEMMDKNIVK